MKEIVTEGKNELSQQTSNKQQGVRFNVFILLLIFLVVLGISAAVGYVLLQNAAPTDTLADTAGLFSDILSPVFAGLAFGGLIYTVILQSRELALQRDELVLTRDELAKTADANQTTAEALEAQARIAERTVKINALREQLRYLDRNDKKVTEMFQNNPDFDADLAQEAADEIDAERDKVNAALFTMIQELHPETIKMKPYEDYRPREDLY